MNQSNEIKKSSEEQRQISLINQQIISNFKFSFPCPNCDKEISDEDFAEEQKAFNYLANRGKEIFEKTFFFHQQKYHQDWLQIFITEHKYEELPEVKVLQETNEELSKEINRLTSHDYIANLEIVQKLKKESEEKTKKILELQSPEYIEKSERVQKLTKKVEDQNQKIIQLQSHEHIEKLDLVQNLKQQLEAQKKQIGELKSYEYLENHTRVKELKSENKELQNQVQLLQARNQASKKKGENFEQYVAEEIGRIFDSADKISKITGKKEKADFLQEVLTENGEIAGRIIYEAKDTEKWDNKWVEKLENDMASYKADFGIIIATCENNKPLRCLDPRKKIYVSDDTNFVYLAKIMRDYLVQKHNLLETSNTDRDKKEKRIKIFEAWISNRLPQFLSRLENELTNLSKNASDINRSVDKIKSIEDSIRKIILTEARGELVSL